jgi:hypothetical protein
MRVKTTVIETHTQEMTTSTASTRSTSQSNATPSTSVYIVTAPLKAPEDSSLHAGAIVGIVLALLAVVGLAAVAVLRYRHERQVGTNFDCVLENYERNSQSVRFNSSRKSITFGNTWSSTHL